MNKKPELCLGTVQFGMPYGVTNSIGKVPEKEVIKILKLATSSEIEFLDTAQAYGSSEEVLGRCWPNAAPRRIISKLTAESLKSHWEASLSRSLKHLKTDKLDAFLLHKASDLASKDGIDLLEWLESILDRGLANRIGVSIYDKDELDNIPLNRLQLVQLPLSIYDQRMITNGTIERLKDLGISIHVRSTFLQGLILKPHDRWPAHISSEFKRHHRKLEEYLGTKDISPLQYALNFVQTIEGIEACLVGVLSTNELAQIVKIWGQNQLCEYKDIGRWSWGLESDLDPRKWTKR